MGFAMMVNQSLVCLSGESGSGKTRMLQAVEAALPHGTVLRVGAETLIDEIFSGLRNEQAYDDVVWCFREIDTLLIDNLWILASCRAASIMVCDLQQSRLAAGRLTVSTSDLQISDLGRKIPEIADLLSCSKAVRLS